MRRRLWWELLGLLGLGAGSVGFVAFVVGAGTPSALSGSDLAALVTSAMTALFAAPLLTLLVAWRVRRAWSARHLVAPRTVPALKGALPEVPATPSLQDILDRFGEGVLIVNKARRIVTLNPAARRLCGEGAALGRLLLEALRSAPLRALVEEATEEPQEAEISLLGAQTRQLMVSAHPLPGQLRLIVLREVTEMRHLEQVRRDFVANVSHELRTPVSAIKLNTESLLGGALEDEAARGRFVEAIARNARRLEAVVQDLLNLAQIESGREAALRTKVALPELLRELVEAARPQALREGSSIELFFHSEHESRKADRVQDFEPGAAGAGGDQAEAQLSLKTEAHAITQIVSNLLNNAFLHGGPGVQVQLRLWGEPASAPTRLFLEVADDGPGIEARYRERIFERFFRVDPARSREKGGTGLGLSIVKNQVQRLDGELRYLPREPKGSIFRISFKS